MKVMIIEASLFESMPEKELKKELNRLKEEHGYHFIAYTNNPVYVENSNDTFSHKWGFNHYRVNFSIRHKDLTETYTHTLLQQAKINPASIEEVHFIRKVNFNSKQSEVAHLTKHDENKFKPSSEVTVTSSSLLKILSDSETTFFQRHTKKIVFSALVLSAGITGALLAQFNVISASMITSLLSASLVINPAFWPLFAGLGMAGAAALLFFVGLGVVYCCRCCCAKSEKDISPEDANSPEAEGLLSGETSKDIPLTVMHPAPNATLYSDPHLLVDTSNGSSETKRDESATDTASTSGAAQSAESIVADLTDTESQEDEEDNSTDKTENSETSLTF